MTEYLAGGRRRVDRVLAPRFLEAIGALDLDEVRSRRTDADQEEADLSYARRLLQGRIDLLRAEQASRHQGSAPQRPRSDAELADALGNILGQEQRNDRGLGRHLGSEPTRVGEHRREAERAVADVSGSDVQGLDDDELTDALERLVTIEARISRTRREVQGVVDTLTEEIARRYMAGEAVVAPQSGATQS
ncbi:MAG: hypothetical protein P8Z68_12375 [Kineosporiaceae bacterium]|jgi:hypothetical protein